MIKDLIQEELNRISELKNSKALTFKELNVSVAKRNELSGKIAELERDSQGILTTISETISNSISNESLSLERTDRFFEAYTSRLKDLEKQATELEEYVAKEKNAHDRFIAEETKLSEAIKSRDAAITKAEEETKRIQEQTRGLDGLKTYLTDFYGKVATYVKVANETVEEVNKALAEKKVPLKFDHVPKIDLSNFVEFSEELRKDK